MPIESNGKFSVPGLTPRSALFPLGSVVGGPFALCLAELLDLWFFLLLEAPSSEKSKSRIHENILGSWPCVALEAPALP